LSGASPDSSLLRTVVGDRSKEGSLTDGIFGAEERERERDDEGRIEDQVRVGAGGGIRNSYSGRRRAQTQGIVLRLDFP